MEVNTIAPMRKKVCITSSVLLVFASFPFWLKFKEWECGEEPLPSFISLPAWHCWHLENEGQSETCCPGAWLEDWFFTWLHWWAEYTRTLSWTCSYWNQNLSTRQHPWGLESSSQCQNSLMIKGLAQLWCFSLIISLFIRFFVVPGIKAGRQHSSAYLLNFKSIIFAFKLMLLVYTVFEFHVQGSLIPRPVSLWYKHGYVKANTGCISFTRNTWTQHCSVWVGFGKGDFGFGTIYLSFTSWGILYPEIQNLKFWNLEYF